MKGLGHAILTGRTLIGDEPFAVVLARTTCASTLEDGGADKQMVKLYNQFRCSIVAIQEVPPEETSKYGVIAGEEMKDGHLPCERAWSKNPSRKMHPVEPGHHRPLHPDSGHLRPDREDPSRARMARSRSPTR
jgi:UTP-glucose-1-phosphate uridylyltransferase